MKSINLSTASKPVLLDPAILCDTRMMLCANSGGGKSHALRLIAEQVGNQIPTLIIDPEGEWATLRTHVQCILVGPGGDVQADPKFAKQLARKLIEADCSAILDLSDLKSGEKRQFVRFFLEGLLAVPRSLWGARIVIVDEAHKFAPESGREAESRQAVIDLMDSGRKRGLGGILATQRLSKIAKDAVAEANNLMLGRFAQDLDLSRASDLLGFTGKQEWQRLRTLKPGEFLALGPAFDHDGVASFRTNSETKTEHPKPGARHLVTPPKPSKKIVELLAKMSDLPQEVDQETELKRLRAEVKDLKGRSVNRTDPDQVAVAVQKAEDKLHIQMQRAIQRIRNQLLSALRSEHESAGKQIYKILETVLTNTTAAMKHGEELTEKVEREFQAAHPVPGRVGDYIVPADHGPVPVVPTCPACTRSEWVVRSRRDDDGAGILWFCRTCVYEWREDSQPKRKPGGWKGKVKGADDFDAPLANGKTSEISGAPYRLLVALLQQAKPISRSRASLLAQMSPKSSTFRNAMSVLRNASPVLISDFSGGDLEATSDAHALYDGKWKALPTGDDLIGYWTNYLGGAPQRLFEVLADHRGWLSRERASDLAEMSPTSSTFRNAMSQLRRLGLMDDQNGKIALGSELAE